MTVEYDVSMRQYVVQKFLHSLILTVKMLKYGTCK